MVWYIVAVLAMVITSLNVTNNRGLFSYPYFNLIFKCFLPN